MKNIITTLCILALCSLANAAEIDSEVPAGELTLVQAQTITLANNPGISESIERLNAVRQILLQTQSLNAPTVNITAGGSLLQGADQPDWNTAVRREESLNQLTAGVNFNWVLFDGFARKANILAAKYSVEQAQSTSYDIKRLLAEAVSAAFLQAQLSQETMAIAIQNQQFNLHLEKQAKLRYQAGTAPEAEMLNFSLRALGAETDYINAQHNFKTACTVLARLMALDNALLPENMYPIRNSTKIERAVYNFNIEFEYAVNNRPDLNAIKAGVLAANEQVNAAKGNYYPTISLNGGIDYTNTNDAGPIDQDENTKRIGLNMVWNIFSGGRKQAAVAQARHNKLALEQNKLGKMLEIQAAIQQAIDTINSLYAVLDRQQKAYDLTVRIRDHVEKSYGAGTTSITRLNEAQTDQVRAAVSLNSARIQCRLAEVSLLSETGRITNK